MVPQLRRALRARVGARHRDGADAGLHRPLRPHPAPARDAWSSLVAVPFGEDGDSIMVWARPALLRRAGVAHLPARRRAVLRPGGRRGGARGAHAPGARARRAARLPGHPVRRPDRVGGAARGAPAAPRRARARAARGGRADAPRGVGARRALRALRLARRVDSPAARRLRRADRPRAGAVGAHGLARDRRRAAFAARDRRAGRDRRPPPRPAHGPVLDREVPRLHAARAARGRDPDRARVRLPAAAARRDPAAGGRRRDARGVPRQPVLRVAADRPLRAHPGGPARALLRPRRVRLADAARRRRAPPLGSSPACSRPPSRSRSCRGT